jgi:hypothetical protein
MPGNVFSNAIGTIAAFFHINDKALVADINDVTFRQIDPADGTVGDRTGISAATLHLEGTGEDGDLFVVSNSVAGYFKADTQSVPDRFTPDVVEEILPVGTITGIVEGRLSVSSTEPVADGTATDAIYFVPFGGSHISLWDSLSANWRIFEFSALTLNINPLTASNVYDVYAYIDSGDAAVEVDDTPWTDNQTPNATDLQDGVIVKSGDPTRRLIGSFYMVSDAECIDTEGKRYLYNLYNQVPRKLYYATSDNFWNSSGGTWQGWNSVTTTQVSVLTRNPSRALSLSCSLVAGLITGGTGGGAISIFRDALVGTGAIQGAIYLPAGEVLAQITAFLDEIPPVGYHEYLAVERDNGGGCGFYGTDGATRTAGLTGSTWA